jgi:hypothetical protein
VADLLRKEPNTQVDVVNGSKGELSVTVDGREVFRKGEQLPEPEQVLQAVRGNAVVGATA